MPFLSSSSVVLPRPLVVNNKNYIRAPSEAAFINHFGSLLPKAQFIESEFGRTATYELPPTSSSPPPTLSIGQRHRTLLIHGLGTPALGLLPLAKRLQAGNPHAHYVLYDLWGHGLSDTPLVPHTAALFHGQILALLSHLKWPSCNIIGFSFGGATAVSLSVFHPELVETLCVVAPAGLLKGEDFTEEQRGFLRGGSGVEEAARDWILQLINGGPIQCPDDWEEEFKRGQISGDPLQIWERANHAGHIASVVGMSRDGGLYDSHPYFSKLSARKVRKLAILGELDSLCSQADLVGVGWAENDIVVIPQAGHAVVRERVPEVVEAMERLWLSDA